MLKKLRQWAAAIKRKLIALGISVLTALGLYSGAVYSQTVTDTLSWTNPTLRIDGSPLTNLATIKISWGKQGGPYTDGSKSAAAPATTLTVQRTGTGIGTICYVAVAIDADGLQSTPTSEVCKTVNAIPAAISGLKVE